MLSMWKIRQKSLFLSFSEVRGHLTSPASFANFVRAEQNSLGTQMCFLVSSSHKQRATAEADAEDTAQGAHTAGAAITR